VQQHILDNVVFERVVLKDDGDTARADFLCLIYGVYSNLPVAVDFKATGKEEQEPVISLTLRGPNLDQGSPEFSFRLGTWSHDNPLPPEIPLLMKVMFGDDNNVPDGQYILSLGNLYEVISWIVSWAVDERMTIETEEHDFREEMKRYSNELRNWVKYKRE